MNSDFFDIAFSEAKQAFDLNEVPIGAVIVKNNKVIASAHNLKETNQNVCCHAEILAISQASKFLNNWRLDECDIYVTLDPCPMCASAIRQARIRNVYSALENLNNEYLPLIKKIFVDDDINAVVNFASNLRVEQSKKLLQDFFKNRR